MNIFCAENLWFQYSSAFNISSVFVNTFPENCTQKGRNARNCLNIMSLSVMSWAIRLSALPTIFCFDGRKPIPWMTALSVRPALRPNLLLLHSYAFYSLFLSNYQISVLLTYFREFAINSKPIGVWRLCWATAEPQIPSTISRWTARWVRQVF